MPHVEAESGPVWSRGTGAHHLTVTVVGGKSRSYEGCPTGVLKSRGWPCSWQPMGREPAASVFARSFRRQSRAQAFKDFKRGRRGRVAVLRFSLRFDIYDAQFGFAKRSDLLGAAQAAAESR